MKYLMLIVCFLPILFSCSQYPENVNKALEMAGKNKPELKKVLDYYSRKSEDSLKFKAACFLIENMKWHHSKLVIPSPELWYLFLLEDSLVKQRMQHPDNWMYENALSGYKYGAKKMLVHRATNQSIIKNSYQSDLNHLNAGFLIETIDAAFKVKELDWCKHLSFDDFYEYVLSYRINNEPVYALRKNLSNHLSYLYNLDSLQRSPYHTIAYLNKYIEYFEWDYSETPSVKDLGFYNIFDWQNHSFTCSNHVVVLAHVMRSIGLPAIEVFAPLGHRWCATLTSDGRPQLFTAIYQDPEDAYVAHDPKCSAKLYENTFGAQPQSPFFIKAPNEDIPYKYSNPCIRDITDQVIQTNNIELDITANSSGNNICWFSIFHKGYWLPVGWGLFNKEKNTALFKNIPVGLIGIACWYENGQTIPCSKLVTVTNNGINCISPDKKRTKLFLTRKYMEKTRMQDFVHDIIGLRVQGANDPNFADAHTLYTLKDTLRPYLQDIVFNNTKKYRYYRLLSPSWGLHIAEIEFLTAHKLPGAVAAKPLPVFRPNKPVQKQFYKLTGQIIGEVPNPKAFDGDMLTYVRKKWIGLDLERPIQINRVRVAPRNANNGIVRGDRYQLYYWDGDWIKAGTKKAKYNFIEFEDVPPNTLYWLKNLDHGTEEQPFFYKNGKQLFSNQ